MPLVSSYHFLLGPIVAAAALGVILLLCRWVFSTAPRDERQQRRLERLAAAGDYGLLTVIARVRTTEDGQMLRAVLRDAGVRANVSEDGSGYAVLVFSQDAARARSLVGSSN